MLIIVESKNNGLTMRFFNMYNLYVLKTLFLNCPQNAHLSTLLIIIPHFINNLILWKTVDK